MMAGALTVREARSVRLLAALGGAPAGLTTVELARRTGLTGAEARRLLHRQEAAGTAWSIWIRRDGRAQRLWRARGA